MALLPFACLHFPSHSDLSPTILRTFGPFYLKFCHFLSVLLLTFIHTFQLANLIDPQCNESCPEGMKEVTGIWSTSGKVELHAGPDTCFPPLQGVMPSVRFSSHVAEAQKLVPLSIVHTNSLFAVIVSFSCLYQVPSNCE